MKHLGEGELQAWLDRPRSAIEPSELERIEEHLGRCERCSERLARLEELGERTRSILSGADPEDDTIPDFAEVVDRSAGSANESAAETDPELRPVFRRRKAWIAAAWAASLAGAIAVGWLTSDLVREPRTALAPPAERSEPARDADTEQMNASPAVGEPTAEAERTTDRTEADAVEAREADPEEEDEQGAQVAGRGEVEAPTRVIRGRITDESGRPVSSAQVFVPTLEIAALSEDDGSYFLTLPAEQVDDELGVRTLPIMAQRIGYGSEIRIVALDDLANDTASADFRLEEEALALDEVVVTGTPESPGRDAGAAAAPEPSVTEEVRATADSAPEWRSVNLSAAARAAGFTVRVVPGLEVLGVEVRERDGRTVARVRQALASGSVLTIVQRPDPSGDAAPEAGPATPDAGRVALEADPAEVETDPAEVETDPAEVETDPAEVSTRDGATTVTERRGRVVLSATAEISADSLRVLLDRIR